MIASEQIKSAVSMPQLLQAYGFQVGRTNEMHCPFHAEKTPSFKVYEDHFHCYGCGAHGDIFEFVQRYFDLTFPQAQLRIAGDFGIDAELSRKQPCEETERIRREREQKALEKYRSDMEYRRIAEEHRQLRRDLIDYAPRSEYDFVHDRYVYALHRVEYLQYLLDEMLWGGDKNRG